MQSESRIERWAFRTLTAAAGLVLLLVVARGWARPHLPFDSWAYHLPFAARLHGIGGDTFVLAPHVHALFDGSPLAAHWLQGALWRLAGSIRAVASLNSVALVGLVAYTATALRLPFASLVFGFLALPIVAVHATSGYIDLFAGVLPVAQAVAGLRCLELLEPQIPIRAPALAGHLVVFFGATALAAQTKLTSLGVALVVCAFFGVAVLVGGRRRLPRAARVALGLGAALIVLVLPLRNWLTYSNPLHPWKPSQLLDAQRRAPESRVYTRALGPFDRPALFALSVTEIDWRIRGVEPHYDIDSNGGDRPRRYFPARTGGLWGGYVGVLLGLVAAGTLRRARRRDWLPRERAWLALLGCVTVAVAFAPHSHILRYWLAWPLMLVIAVVMLWAREPRARLALAATLAAAFLWSYFALPSAADFRPLPFHRYDREAMRAQLAPELLAAIDSQRRFCLDASHWPMQFRYAAAVVGGDHVIEQTQHFSNRPDRCRFLPRLEVATPAVRRPETPP